MRWIYAKFFHPKTLGVMHWGKVRKVSEDGKRVLVHFDIDDRAHWTTADHYIPGRAC